MEDIFVIKEYRKVKKDHTFSYQGKTYKINNPLEASLAHRKIEVRKSNQGHQTQFYFGDDELNVCEAIEVKKCPIIEESPKRQKWADASADERLKLVDLFIKKS